MEETEGLKATVDLERQKITLHTPDEIIYGFEIDAGSKERLVNGLDDIAISLKYEDDITRFEKKHKVFLSEQF